MEAVKVSGSVLDGQTLAGLIAGGQARAVFVRPDGGEAERAVAAAFGRNWARASMYGRARRLLVERTPEQFLVGPGEGRGPARRARARRSGGPAPDQVGRHEPARRPLPQARREVDALWLADEMTMGEFFVEFQPIFDLKSGEILGHEGLLRAKGRGRA